ncbi:MAG: hypothetical protein ABWY47_17180 [Xanthobacteraceae bacterium]
MKRALLSLGALGAAVALAAAALPISAGAQSPGVRGGATPGGGISAGARSGMSAGGAIAAPRSGGNFAVSPGGAPRSAVSPGGAPRSGGQSFAQGGGNWQGGRNWQGGGNWQHHRRHHLRGPGIAFGLAAPYYYDYATPYVYEGDDDCWQIRLRRGEYVRVWVCE